jgi:hypothetical protein
MKTFVTLLLLSYMLMLNAWTNKKPENAFQKIEWLLGTWNRTNVKPGKIAMEEWTRVSGTVFSGRGFSIREKDTTTLERLRIIQQGNDLFYEADVAQNRTPVLFKITILSDSSFQCENQLHDFPKLIHYKKNGSQLTATISGNGKSIDYLFERIGRD